MNETFSNNVTILDIGYKHGFSDLMSDWDVVNTDYDLDMLNNTRIRQLNSYKQIIAFEVLEHLLNPYSLLQSLSGKMLITVPLNLWWRQSYWEVNNTHKQHYHEFEVRQFNKLLTKTGWKILYSEQWKIDLITLIKNPGFRTLPRLLWPSFYFVVVEKRNY